jgi:hypothetical protein
MIGFTPCEGMISGQSMTTIYRRVEDLSPEDLTAYAVWECTNFGEGVSETMMQRSKRGKLRIWRGE